MSTVIPAQPKPEIEYPDSDGQPMADNTLQYEWIVTIKGNLDALYRNEPNVFVAGDLLWYAVEGQPAIRMAPDVLVAFGRPKGYRGSYRQWQENNVAPQVVFEILSPGNRVGEMIRKFRLYERYGVEEYYLYDPDRGDLTGWLRDGAELREIPAMHGWVSPRLGIRFELVNGELKLYHPDGRPFATYLELVEQREALERELGAARAKADQERQQRETAQAELERLQAQLRALGVEPQR